uniref:NADH-ubiquinone oxidoreductase chain 1 n=1 Tax=Trisidos kiyonoi TaxID=935009 RepID=A0A1U9ALR3_TRIKY|nr:NADH dehydrogenase subunit 1 [Trisidos kiyonoi]
MGIFSPLPMLKVVMKEWIIHDVQICDLFDCSVLLLVLGLGLWFLSPFYSVSYHIKWGGLYFLVISGFGVIGIIMAGWSSNSKYAMLGTMRAVAQVVSYEVVLGIILLCPLCLCGVSGLIDVEKFVFMGLINYFMFQMWCVSMLIENQRAPFDLAEGESELVSGFHVEYGGAGFALIFLSEYSMLLMLGVLTASLFFATGSYVVTILLGVFFSWCTVWVRATFPRFRYDKLMMMTWKSFIPGSIASLIFSMMVMVVGDLYSGLGL